MPLKRKRAQTRSALITANCCWAYTEIGCNSRLGICPDYTIRYCTRLYSTILCSTVFLYYSILYQIHGRSAARSTSKRMKRTSAKIFSRSYWPEPRAHGMVLSVRPGQGMPCIHIYIYAYTNTYTCVYHIHTYLCIYTCTYTCTHTHKYIHMYICIHVDIHIPTYTYTPILFIFVHTCTCKYMYSHVASHASANERGVIAKLQKQAGLKRRKPKHQSLIITQRVQIPNY